MKKEAITHVLNSLGNKIDKEQIELYKKLLDESQLSRISDFEDFYFLIIYPFEQYLSGLISVEFSDNKDVRFILKNSIFVERFFLKLIEVQEGHACSAYKSRTIIRALIKFYSKNEKISFDYNQEYTYHLPKKIFKTHSEIVSFYEGLKDLFYGSHDKYLKEILKISKIK